jgi:two-component system, NtrC family, response regulator AtoC
MMNTKQEKSADRFGENAQDGVLIVDADPNAARVIVSILETDGFQTTWLTDADAAVNLLKERSFAFVLCDHATPGMDGLEFLRAVKAAEPGTMAVVMSESGGIETALEAIKLGASDYITKPVNATELLLTIRKAQERERLRLENEILKSQVAKRYSFGNIIAKSPAMLEIFETVKKIADYKTTILLYGESGTGKELIAKAVHHNSVRRNKRFVALNCGAIPENLLESELFGHKRGSFTDALRDKKGLFEEADGGTILLDEIGELPMHLQVKILRVLQENEIRPVGDSRIIPINVRVIAATLRDLESDILEGRFRDDLFYRLNVITLRIPPLRERKEDIPLLVNHFIKRNQERLGLPVFGIAKDAMSALMDHDWPGNIRELENSIERAMILTDGNEVTLSSLPKTVRGNTTGTPRALAVPDNELSIKVLSRMLEESLIRRALEKTNGNRTHAARLLEISHRTLLYKLKEYNLANDADVADETTSTEE